MSLFPKKVEYPFKGESHKTVVNYDLGMYKFKVKRRTKCSFMLIIKKKKQQHLTFNCLYTCIKENNCISRVANSEAFGMRHRFAGFLTRHPTKPHTK